VIRFWLAKLFFMFGVSQLIHWQVTLALAGNENPIPFIAPAGAAYISTACDLAGAALLALGFMTRYAAIPLLALSFITQWQYEPFDTQLFWTALFGWFAINGAGPVSMDGLLRHGLEESAIPLIPRIIGFSKQLRSRGSPLYASMIRVWLGLALLLSALAGSMRWNLASVARWLPLDVAMRTPVPAAFLGGALLVLGVGTRYVAIALLLSLFAYSVTDPRATDAIYLAMLLAMLGVHGGGSVSLDLAIDALRRRLSRKQDPHGLPSAERLPRVVIVGAGFGGLRCAEALRHVRVSVTLIDRNNYHLFQPLLYQVATAALSPGDIAMPARPMFRDAPNTRLLLGAVTGIDTKRQTVLLESTEIPYDYLVLATGATHSYFGKEEWAAHAPGLKGIEDALAIRRRILTAFEQAEATSDVAERAALLSFLVVGGGPTGVELAGAIAELARYGLEQEFRSFDPAQARVILVQAAARLLPAFPEGLAATAQRCLERLGVEVRLNCRVDHIDGDGVSIDGLRVAARTVLWAAGVAASPAAQWLKAPADRAGRLIVGGDLRVPAIANVFAIGDTASSKGWRGENVPGLAPAAKQGGAYVARYLRALIESREPPPAFRYRHRGSLATIGRKAAIADFGIVRLWGAPAWWLWGVVHLAFMLGVRNRLATLTNWFWAYLKFGAGIRLITGA
jgi:putative oxidoreductase